MRQRPNQRENDIQDRKHLTLLVNNELKIKTPAVKIVLTTQNDEILRRFNHNFKWQTLLNLRQPSLPFSNLFWVRLVRFYAKSSMPRCWFCCSNNSNHLMWLLLNPDRLSWETIHPKKIWKAHQNMQTQDWTALHITKTKLHTCGHFNVKGLAYICVITYAQTGVK